MFIFEKIQEAEKADGDQEISIRADQFLCLIDTWLLCNLLTSQIHDGDEEEAAMTMIKISHLIVDHESILKGD